ncbi:glycine oxidase ThiO [Actinokineospora bangkokensis]|uniref:glycine oxidase n=1 Tax=Actinokineospora bangkokensis TaxID=1193682 RepID=A0A1Q9LCQ5_9PSEU|nr:glycine oxidase ThiO [Actinokineospora bangkokensis]OLR89810.1 glycine oxidase ThiO [Actinokineospora bangkokensis]
MSVAVIGGGVVGLTAAHRLATAGRSVVVVDPAPRTGGGSWVAAGMLAPVTEAWLGEEAVLALGTAALDAWEPFARELGGDIGLRPHGTLAVAFDAAEAADLRRLADFLESRGRAVRRLTGRELRALEPGLGAVRSGLDVPGDLSVDTRKLLTRLDAACRAAGVRFVDRRAVGLVPGGVLLDDPGDPENPENSTVDCDAVVVAAGAWSRDLHPALADLVRPVKGEVLVLRARSRSLPPPTRTVRAHVDGRSVYLVPRAGGHLVVGATQQDVGFDTEVTAGGVADLLADAERVLPGVRDYELVEAAAGLRAGSRDNLPLVGVLEPGVVVATGHHRNGVLMAPLTAEAVAALVLGGPVPGPVAAAAPSRFGGVV